jgi:beta-mannosidase
VEYGWDFSRPQPQTGPGTHRIRVRSEAALVEPVFHQDAFAQEGTWSVRAAVAAPGNYRTAVTAEWTDAVGKRVVQTVSDQVHQIADERELSGSVALHDWPLWQPRQAGGRLRTVPQRVHMKWQLWAVDGPAGAEHLVDSASIWTGKRTVALEQTPEHPFALVVNGERRFCAGVNAVRAQNRTAYPAESPTLREEDVVLQQRMEELARSGANTVRFWGGGRYPSERLLRCADSLGLMLWVDFSFAGTAYPTSGPVFEEMKQEVERQTARLSAHPSVVLLCGNNELEVAWNNWGWQKKYGIHGQDSLQMAQGMQLFFREFVPTVLARQAPGTLYLPTSPLSNWGKPSDFQTGNNHDWRVWHGEQPTAVLAERIAPFVTEWGVPSYPGPSVRQRWVGSNDHYLFSYKGMRLLDRYLENETNASQRSLATERGRARWSRRWQARVISRTIAAQAADPHCGGSLVWQLNDVDDAISWSLLDADNRPKPAWRAAKRAWRRIRR